MIMVSTGGGPQQAGDLADPAWLEAACLGSALPPAVEAALAAAGAAWHDDPRAEAHLATAAALAPHHPAVYIARYRFLFYKNRLHEAFAIGMRCLSRAAELNGLAPDWRAVAPADADFAAWSVAPRFYLFTLKGCAYLSLRLGMLEQGRDMLAKLRELDPADRLGGSVLEQVLARQGADDE